MTAHNCLLYAKENLENVEHWVHTARAYDFNEVDNYHARAIAKRAIRLAERIEELRKEKAI